MAGARSGLFAEQIRVIGEMRNAEKRRGRTALAVRPRYGIWENVVGALSSGRDPITREKRPGADFQIVLQSFLQIEEPHLHVVRPETGRWEYAGAVLGVRSCVAWVTWDAQYLGVPQRSQILLDTVPSKYYSSQTACRGILRRSEERGKELPKKLKTALMIQAGLCSLDELSELNAEADSNSSDGQGVENTKFSAGFSAGAGSSAGSIAYSEQIAPTLKGSASGNCMPSVLCLNDQGGSIMECSENISGTLRSQEHGHQPLVLPEGPALYENHGIDARYRGPLSVAPTLPARAGTGGNNLSLVAQPKPASSRQVYARPRSDAFRETDTAGTQSARQSKDATDVVLEQPFLIRRLVPIECERLQGYPDGWTDVPGASDSARYRALGNSVAIPCVEYIMRRITKAFGH